MVGEFNVRNAAMAAAGGLFAGLGPDQIREAFLSFEVIARSPPLRVEVRGVRVIDDFAHHPTAIRMVIEAFRQRYPESRIWAVFEPRSNTTRRNIFQKELAESLATADYAVVPAIADPGKVARSASALILSNSSGMWCLWGQMQPTFRQSKKSQSTSQLVRGKTMSLPS
mgnify:CR=1 FL=1